MSEKSSITKTKQKTQSHLKDENPFTKLIHELEKNKPKFKERTNQALQWYLSKIQAIEDNEQDPLTIYETKRKTTFRFCGQIVTFKYDPKLKFELEYYDLYPLTIVIKLYPDGFLGLNLHYLKPIDRAIFMNSLYKYQGEKELQTIINIKYEKLASSDAMRHYKPCIKRYRYKNMSPKIAVIDPHLWDIALFLPTEKFLTRKRGGTSSKNKIWQHSRRLIRKR